MFSRRLLHHVDGDLTEYIMKLTFVRHFLLNRGGDKMVLAHAAYLIKRGHEVCLKTNVVNTIFDIDSAIKIVPFGLSGKFGTLFSTLSQKCDADLVLADIIPLAFSRHHCKPTVFQAVVISFVAMH